MMDELGKEYICEQVPTKYREYIIIKTELIRCKDCKHWLPHEQFGFDADNDEYHNYCGRLVPDDDYYAYTREADEYCSRAERKENDENSK